MKSKLTLLAAIILLAALRSAWAAEAGMAIGHPELIQPSGTAPSGTVVLFSDAGGWGSFERSAAAALAGQGFAVIGIDLPATLQRIEAHGVACATLIGEIEAVSHRMQRQAGAAAYHFPVLAGSGAGGTAALAVAGQAAAATIAGAVAVNPAPALLPSIHAVLCDGHGRPGTDRLNESAYLLQPAPLPYAVVLRTAQGASPATRDYVRQLGTGRQDVSSADSNQAPLDALLAGIMRAGQQPGGDALADLPLIELPPASLPAAQPAADTLAVLYSGDGGWRDLDKDVAALLQREGMPVVGVDVLRYFWTRRSPEQGAHDLARIIGAYRAKWQADKVVLIGYSFGADVLPAIYNRLPPETRQHVVQLSLLGFSSAARFEVSIAGWLGRERGETMQTLPETARIDPHLLQCFYGADDEAAACRQLKNPGVEIIRTTGGHHFDGDYEALARRILLGARQRSTP